MRYIRTHSLVLGLLILSLGCNPPTGVDEARSEGEPSETLSKRSSRLEFPPGLDNDCIRVGKCTVAENWLEPRYYEQESACSSTKDLEAKKSLLNDL
jgi:hypothetical protein